MEKGIKLEFIHRKEYNYVYYQTDCFYKQKNSTIKTTPYSLIEKIIITNESDDDYSNCVISFESNNDIIQIENINIASIFKRSTTYISEGIKINLNVKELYKLTEEVPVNITVKLYNEKTYEELLSEQILFTLNPINEISSIKEDVCILSSFVTPNNDIVGKIINSAFYELKGIRNKETAFYGYLSNDIDSVREEMMAIFKAIKRKGISYVLPPASFNEFQKVRLPKDVVINGKGTCLDLAILYCSCLESVGLRPILIIKEGHAFAGCFLSENTFESYFLESPSYIYNLSAYNNTQIELVECTLLTNDKEEATFRGANEAARNHLRNYHGYFEAIDIFKCHQYIYRPIPEIKYNDQNEEIIDFPIMHDVDFEVKSTADNGVIFTSKKQENDKFFYWSRKLLDLSLRNRLINFKFNSKSPYIFISTIRTFIESITNSEKLKVVPTKIDNNLDDIQKVSLIEIREYERNGKFAITGSVDDYRSLCRKAVGIVEETGSNALYLSLGLVRFTPRGSKRDFYAPLFLVPAFSKVKGSNNSYELDLNFDAITINTTLFEYLKQNFLISLDEIYSVNKENLERDYNTIINLIRSKSSEDCEITVEDDKCYLSILYFANYIIWNDISNRKEELLKNDIIKCLVEGKPYRNSEEDTDLKDIDKNIQIDDVAIPLGADSSQVKAILDCGKGESFVLDGPPGTGKSQTIVNMIVNALYNKKSVLFVAEKMVALEVVKKRIDEIHLGNFCLELHSSKSNKRDFLNQIEQSMELERIVSPKEFDDHLNDLEEKKKYLNQLINKTTERKYIYSLHDAVLRYEELREFDFKESDNYFAALHLDDKRIKEIVDGLNTLKEIESQRGKLCENPYRGLLILDNTKINDKFFSLVTDLRDALINYYIRLTSFLGEFNFTFKKTRKNVMFFNKILEILMQNKCVLNNIFEQDFVRNYETIKETIIQGVKLSEDYAYLFKTFKKSVLNIDEDYIKEVIETLKSGNVFTKFFAKHNIKRELKAYLEIKEHKLTNKEIEKYLFLLNLIKEEEQSINLKTQYIEQFERISEDLTEVNFKNLLVRFDNGLDLLNKVDLLLKDMPENEVLENKLRFCEIFDLKDGENVKNNIEIMIQEISKVRDYEAEFSNKYDFVFLTDFDEIDSSYMGSCIASLNKALDEKNEIYNLIIFNRVLKELEDLGLYKYIIQKYRVGIFSVEELKNRFLVSVYKVILNNYFKDPYYNEFNGILFNEAIKKYDELLSNFSTLVIEKTANILTQDFPVSNVRYAESSKIYSLRKLIKNGGRGQTIRGILEDYEDLIRTFCPCFFMSPLSAAQYLSLDTKKFDIVIFDEASQIPTCEAIGAISRGNSLIVAGDPQQMPPTNFFKANITSLDEYDESIVYEDLESLLDDCITLKMKRNRLLWHYRSAHESLIAFSNNYFYDHNLYTFPSPDNKLSKVSFNYLKDGVYESGINKVEAKAIVKEIIHRLDDPILSKQSIGIVCFNIKQQEFVYKELQKEVMDNPKYLELINNEEDPLFIKNLENVQGDERDVIIFSVGFGYNPEGKFLHNFGPLSLDKGERRLNVAITRARKEMIIYSSIKSSDIDARRVKNKGAAVLKSFLLYAEQGLESLEIENKNQIISEIGVQNFIKEDLAKLGIESDINVGDSKFKIDLCIKNSEGKYILGIICDSDTYLSTPTCRDRNYVHSLILTRLKWKIIRIFTIDYFKNKDQVIKDILKALENLENLDNNVDEIEVDDVNFEKAETNESHRKKDYLKYKVFNSFNYENYQVERMYPELVTSLENVINYEGPISENLLLQRFKDFFGLERVGPKVKRLFNIQLRYVKSKKVAEINGYFYYPLSINLDTMDYYRTSSIYQRSLEQLPIVEVKNAMIEILKLQREITLEDMIKSVGYAFGASSISLQSSIKIKEMIDYILAFYKDFTTNQGKIDLKK